MSADLLNRFVLRMKLKRVNCSVVYQCAMFHRILKSKGVDSRVVQGYCMVQGSACRHYWVEAGDCEYDVARKLSSLFDSEINRFEVFLTNSIPDETPRLDMGEECVEENEREYEKFIKNPTVFWSCAPSSVKNAHLKI